ncbi:MAG: hypothetical protein K9G57_02040 [Ignavibacteriales bacterium]|nr:hypothetical protein [Ignavibacteriales bacterium]
MRPEFFLALTFLTLLLFFAEKTLIKKLQKKISKRVLVNGTRGKSSVTRLLLSNIRDGLTGIAKITGDEPRIFYSDGTNQLIKRIGPARISEQIKVLFRAVRFNSEFLAIENMSVSPELMIQEARIIEPEIYIVTNVRNDHQEEFGGDISAIMNAFFEAIPHKSRVITSDHEFYKFCLERGMDSGRLIYSDSRTDEYLESNLNLAHKTLKMLGIDNDSLKAISKPKESLKITKTIGGCNIDMYPAFSANDCISLDFLLPKVNLTRQKSGKRVLLFNTRADRPLRTLEFIDWIKEHPDIDSILIFGTHKEYGYRILKKKFGEKITIQKESSVPFTAILQDYIKTEKQLEIIGLGNYKGAGERLTREMMAI